MAQGQGSGADGLAAEVVSEVVVTPLAEISSEKGPLEPGGTVCLHVVIPKTVTSKIGRGEASKQT